jgi:uncharacterized protein (TIGR04141 family)
VTDPNKVIPNRDDLEVEPVFVDGELIGILHLTRMFRPQPSWLTFFAEATVDLDRIDWGTASWSAVLLLQQPDTFYAITFGFGYSLLGEGVIDERFGIRTTLNSVEPSQLRSMDHKRVESIARHTRENLSKGGPVAQFGMDINRDLLRAVTGKPTDESLGRRLSGSDALTATADFSLVRLREYLGRYHELSERDDYRSNFPWVDNIQYVRDEAVIAQLEKKLAKALLTESTNVWLSPPEMIDWSKTRGFKYRSSKIAEEYEDLYLKDYFVECGGAAGLDDGRRLAQDRIFHLRTDTDTSVHSWAVIRCLVAEVTDGNAHYVLSEGAWYRINQSFLDELDDFVKNIPQTAIQLPDHQGTKNENEGAYNKRAWKASKSAFSLLDEKFIYYGSSGKVEICDLYTKSRQLVHVKRLSGSSTLSHLFNQGTVSAELLKNEVGFRDKFLEMLPPDFRWSGNPSTMSPQDFEVCYAILRRPAKELTLPFFSKLTLRSTIERLSGLGYHASLIGVPSI